MSETAKTEEPTEIVDEFSLDDIFSDEAMGEDETDEVESEQSAEEPGVEDTEETESEDSTPESDSEGDEATPEKSEAEKPDEPWHLKAVLDEREKRQKAEAELNELRKKLSPESKEKVSVFDDEEKALGAIKDELRKEFMQRDLDRSEKLAVKQFGKEKVEQATEWFNENALQYPALLKQFHESGNDISEVVTMFDRNQKMSQMEDVESFEAKIRAEERARVEAEFTAKQQNSSKKRDSIKPSLAKQTSAGEIDQPDEDDLSAICLGD